MKQTSHDIKIRRDRMMPLLLVYATTAVLLFAANIISPGFLTVAHLGNVARQASFLGIVSIGQTLIILTGGIDLSTSYLITLTNIVAAQIMDGKNANIAAACITVLLIGLVAGAINGLGICFMHIPPIVMTLATGNVLLGIAYIYCNGSPKGYRAPLLEQIVNGRVLGVLSGSVIIWILLAVGIVFLLAKTTFGRSVYAIGVNAEAARYSNIHVSSTLILSYIIAGIVTAVPGILLVGYTGSAYMSTGSAYGMDSIAAVVIGGTAITGGHGGYAGTIAGVLIMTILTSLMTMLNMADAGRQIVQGLIIVILLVAVYSRNKKA